MYILHIETSTKVCSVALSDNTRLLKMVELREGMNHTAILAPSINDLLNECGVEPLELKAISISAGPGSFTGLRVGSSTAKGMAYALGIPILSVPTLWALAAAAFKKYDDAERVMPMIDARRMEVYTSVYKKDGSLEREVGSYILEEGKIEDLFSGSDKVIICGDGAKKVDLGAVSEKLIVDHSIQSSAVHLIEPAYRLYMEGKFSDSVHYVPFYLKPPNITKPRDKALS